MIDISPTLNHLRQIHSTTSIPLPFLQKKTTFLRPSDLHRIDLQSADIKDGFQLTFQVACSKRNSWPLSDHQIFYHLSKSRIFSLSCKNIHSSWRLSFIISPFHSFFSFCEFKVPAGAFSRFNNGSVGGTKTLDVVIGFLTALSYMKKKLRVSIVLRIFQSRAPWTNYVSYQK